MDIEGFLHVLGFYPVFHGALHSILGATIIGIVAVILSYEAQNALDDRFKERANIGNMFFSGFFGAYSHILLDAFIYDDLNLAWPLKQWNPFFGLVEASTIIELSIVAFVAGILIFLFRKLIWSEKEEG